MLHKEVLYQESIKVPLLMRVPWITNEYKQIAGHASQIDLVPTLLGLMGVPLPSHLEGRSLEPVLRGETFLEGNAVIVETNGPLIRAEAGVPWPSWHPWRTVISGDGWKLNLSTVDQCELYDLNEDPTEENNLYDDPGQKDRISNMTTLLQQWQQETDDDRCFRRCSSTAALKAAQGERIRQINDIVVNSGKVGEFVAGQAVVLNLWQGDTRQWLNI